MKPLKNYILKLPPYLPTLVVALAICYLTLVPDPFGDETPQLFPYADKVAHFLMFGGFASVIYFDRGRSTGSTDMTAVFVAVLLSSIAGGIVEIAQALVVPGRSGDFPDFIADCAGAVVCAFAASMVCRKMFGWK